MMKNSISILGSGWLGLPLIDMFVKQGYAVKASTRNIDKLPLLSQHGATGYIVDTQFAIPKDFLDSETLVINITGKDLDAYQKLALAIASSPVQKVLMVSSTSVYLNLNRQVSEDEAAENPDSTLWQIEQLLQTHEGFTTTIVRFSGLIGGRRHPGRFFRQGKVIRQPLAPVNLIHLDDCLGIIDAIIQQQSWEEVYNGCADFHPAKREFYGHWAAQLGLPEPKSLDDDTPQDWKIVSNQKVQQRLAYQFIHPDLYRLSFDD